MWAQDSSASLWSPLALVRSYLARRARDASSTTAPDRSGARSAAFDERLRAEVSGARRHRTSLALMLADVDRLRIVNGVHGAAAGDELLAIVHTAMNDACGPSELAARYAGDQLVLLAPGATATALVMRARAIQQRAERLALERALPVLPSFSIGIADLDRAVRQTADGLVAAAEQALSYAKTVSRRGGGLAVASRCAYEVDPMRIHLLTD